MGTQFAGRIAGNQRFVLEGVTDDLTKEEILKKTPDAAPVSWK